VTEEDLFPLLRRYRSTISQEATPALDALILKAASRRVVHVRTMRRSVVALAMAAAVAVTWPLWHAHGVRAPEARDVSGYGREEGATRYYLLNVASVQYVGPGSTEHGQ